MELSDSCTFAFTRARRSTWSGRPAAVTPASATRNRTKACAIRLRAGIVDERFHFGSRGRQAGEIERETPDQRAPAGWRGRSESVLFQTGGDEGVNRRLRPGFVLEPRNRGLLARLKSSVPALDGRVTLQRGRRLALRFNRGEPGGSC